MPTVAELAHGVRAGDRAALGRAITLVESRRSDHQEAAQELLAELLPATGNAWRVGITGVPGVGKSTFIESLGERLVEAGRRVAVLAVDPSSRGSGGSILGDKTRMTRLGADPRAFVRPSPTGGSLGGVARRTREAGLVCEAAGYDVVLVETVGVGQSEIVVAEMVDCVVLLLLPHAGDELQGIKRGILEVVDVVAVNKADGERREAARVAAAQYRKALRFLPPVSPGWKPPVVTVSGRDGDGLDELWRRVAEHRSAMEESGEVAARRRRQARDWLWSLVDDGLRDAFRSRPAVAAALPELEREVEEARTPAALAANRLLALFRD